MYTCVYIYICIHVYTCVYMCIHVYTYVYIVGKGIDEYTPYLGQALALGCTAATHVAALPSSRTCSSRYVFQQFVIADRGYLHRAAFS